VAMVTKLSSAGVFAGARRDKGGEEIIKFYTNLVLLFRERIESKIDSPEGLKGLRADSYRKTVVCGPAAPPAAQRSGERYNNNTGGLLKYMSKTGKEGVALA